MKLLLGIVRLLGLLLIILLYLIPIAIGVGVFQKDMLWAIRRRQGIARALLWWGRVKVHQTGTPRNGNYLFICNHLSYLDPVIASPYVAFLPVAKAEVSNWPLFGFGVKVTGVLLVNREDKNSRAGTRQEVRAALKKGLPVLIYPEGTTSDGTTTLPFRPGAFQIAAEEGIPIQPMTLRFERKSDAWTGKTTFVPHLISTFGNWTTHVSIHFSEPMTGTDGIALMEAVRAEIESHLSVASF